MKIAVIGNYPPRKCGIATYTENFVNSLLSTNQKNSTSPIEIDVFAMTDRKKGYNYPKIVKKSIGQKHLEDYYETANIINKGNYDYCHIQHEFGIFCGHSGLFVNIFLSQIKIPIFITLHTVLKELNFHQRQVLDNMNVFSNQLIVMSQMAREILMNKHGISKDKISVIPHGAPVFKSLNKIQAKESIGWSDYTILMTFGLIGRSKGIETAIKALPEACKKHPHIRYVILGKTHPHILIHEGESYRKSLAQLSKKLGVEENVIFLDEYVNEKDIIRYLEACDIYITPYLNEAQITSGTLTYAVSSGSAVLSTPYWHAIELLAKDRGILFNFKAHQELEQLIIKLLDQALKLKNIQEKAYEYGKSISWPILGNKSLERFKEILAKSPNEKRKIEDLVLDRTPLFSLDYFHNLSDTTGLFQHAHFTLPDYNHGYCTDDNARALLMILKYNQQYKTTESELLVTKLLSFLHYMQLENGFFVNMLSYSRKHLKNNISEDCFGRAIWALGYAIKFAPLENQRAFAKDMFIKAIPYFKNLNEKRGLANSILGIVYYLKEFPYDKQLEKILNDFLEKLNDSFLSFSNPNWQWYEELIAYDNAILPLAMLQGGDYLKQKRFIDIAFKSIHFLEKHIYQNKHLSVIGNENWLRKGQNKSQFAQQPVDVMAMVLLYKYLYKLTKEKKYKSKLKIAFSWFLGNNDLYISLYDKESKGCADGLYKDQVNLNQGAESLLAWQIAFLSYRSINDTF
jgi:glycosyltransferase involved in cell wall biosynthesis